MNLTAIIPTRNRPEQLRRRIEELKDLNCEIIVVDDYSQQPVALNGAKVIRNPQRLGYGQSCNMGLKQANRDWLLLIADDIAPSTEFARFIGKLLPRLNPQDLVGFRIAGFATFGSRRVRLYRDSMIARILNIVFGTDISRHSGPSRFVPGAMIIHSNLFSSLGGFDSCTYGGNGFREESDLQWRARKMGGRLIYVEDPFFMHLDVPGGYAKRRRSENDLYFMRNQTIFAIKSRSPASFAMIAAYGAYMLYSGYGISTLVRGVSQGLASVINK